MIRIDTVNNFKMMNLANTREMEDFIKSYDMTPVEFMSCFSDNIEIDIKDKIVVISECGNYGDAIVPFTLSNIYVPEECNKAAKLIYSGHITFLIYTAMNGKEVMLYKDDECRPQTLSEFCDPWNGEESEAELEAMDRGFKVEDIATQVELTMRALHDFNYRLTSREDVIILQGS